MPLQLDARIQIMRGWRKALMTAFAFGLVLGPCARTARADDPCPGRQYPVIVIDVSKGQDGTPVIACSDYVLEFLHRTPADSQHRKYDLNNLTPLVGNAEFLRDGRPVKIYVVNRRFMTSYTAALNAVFALPASTVDIRGVTPPAGLTSTPASKGFIAQSSSGNLLTTDQAVAYMLNDETFDKPFNRVTDDAAAVIAQKQQIDDTLATFVARIGALEKLGDSQGETPTDLGTLPGLISEWGRLHQDVVNAENTPGVSKPFAGIDEIAFAQWMSRADRLITEMGRVNGKVTSYPFADVYLNLRASLFTLKDNARAVQEEAASVQRAMDILNTAIKTVHPAGGSLEDRQRVELRNALRTRYLVGIVSDQTLAQIVNNSDGRDRLQENLSYAAPPSRPESPEASGKKTSHTARDIHASDPNSKALPIYSRYWKLTQTIDDMASRIDVDGYTQSAGGRLRFLSTEVDDLNGSEAQTLRKLNLVYDNFAGPYESLPYLNLNGASGNLHVNYSLSATEQYHRYQIVADLSAPQSNCVLSNSSVNASVVGYAPCTAAATAAPAPSVTYSTTAPAQGSTAAVAAVTGAAPPTPLPVITKEFDMHHFTNGALIAGIAYDSVANQTFAWQQCPVGTPPPGETNPPCYSTPAASGATQTYNYEFLRTTQAPVAATAGILLYFKPRDMFAPHPDRGALGGIFAVSAYPVNHYFLGPAYEFKTGISLSGGVTFGATNVIPNGYNYAPGSVTATPPTNPSETHFKTGAFLMLSFDAYLFKAIFTGGPVVPTIGAAAPSK